MSCSAPVTFNLPTETIGDTVKFRVGPIRDEAGTTLTISKASYKIQSTPAIQVTQTSGANGVITINVDGTLDVVVAYTATATITPAAAYDHDLRIQTSAAERYTLFRGQITFEDPIATIV